MRKLKVGDRVWGRFTGRPGRVVSMHPAGVYVRFDGETKPYEAMLHPMLHLVDEDPKERPSTCAPCTVGLHGSCEQGGCACDHTRRSPDGLFVRGWNDRVCGRVPVVFRRSVGGKLTMNLSSLERDPAWTEAARAEYVRGWDEASARILSLEIKETRT